MGEILAFEPTLTASDKDAGARARLLKAGLELLNKDPVLENLRLHKVCARAGLTKGAFYHYWPSEDEFSRDLLVYGVVERRREVLKRLEDHVWKLAIEQRPLPEIIEAATRMGVRAVEEDSMFGVQMSLWTRNQDPKSAAALRELYKELEGALVPIFERLLGIHGFQTRDSFGPNFLAQIVIAFAEGSALRRRVDKDALPLDELVWVLRATAMMVTRQRGDERTVQEFWNELREVYFKEP